MILRADVVKQSKLKALKAEVAKLSSTPKLKVMMVGDKSASQVYVRNKVNFGKKVGIDVEVTTFDEDITEAELLAAIEVANNDEAIHGLFVQLPIPKTINEENIIKAIKPSKDVDGFTFENIGKLFIGDDSGLVPCTVEGIIDILNYYEIDVIGKNVCVVGRSNIVGKPLTMRLINEGATVTCCNSKTKDIKEIIKSSDIFISAIGQAKFFDQSYFTNNPNLVIIDVGMNRDEDNKLCGDVDFNNVEKIVRAITPVPGGVGVMTHVNVTLNVIKAYKEQKGE